MCYNKFNGGNMNRAEYREKVLNILREHNLFMFPIDVIKLSQEIGFKIFEQELDYSGAILVNDDEEFEIGGLTTNKAIIINAKDAYTRQLFTIAHELGHYFLHKNGNKIYAHRETNGGYNQIESEANSFAAELLMPYDEFVSKYLEYDNTSDSNYKVKRQLANYFGVSLPAVENRIINIIGGKD